MTMGKTAQQRQLKQTINKELDAYRLKRLQAIKEQEDARRDALMANDQRALVKREFYVYEIDAFLKKATREGIEYGCLLTAFEQERSFVVSMVSTLNRFFHIGPRRMKMFLDEFKQEREFTIDELDTLDKMRQLNEKLGIGMHFERPERLNELERLMDAEKVK